MQFHDIEYVKNPVTGKAEHYFEALLEGEDKRRLFVLKKEFNGDEQLSKILSYEVYYKPSTPGGTDAGTLMELPMDDAMGEDNQPTSSICRMKLGGSSARNIYVTGARKKKGWRYAVGADLEAQRAQGALNVLQEKKDKEDNNPARVQERAALIQAQAMELMFKRMGGFPVFNPQQVAPVLKDPPADSER